MSETLLKIFAGSDAALLRALGELISLSELDLIVGCSSLDGTDVGGRRDDANFPNFFVRDFFVGRKRDDSRASGCAANHLVVAGWRAGRDGK
jgi:hypothetical protein